MIIVVSGLPRSGTSLMMSMLEAAAVPLLVDEQRPADSSNPMGYFEYAPVKRIREDASWLDNAEGRAVKIVCPLLMHLPEGPDYRVILMRRPIESVVASQQAMLDRLGRAGAGLPAEKLHALMQRDIERCAEWLDRHPSLTWLDVSYNALLDDPTAQAARIVNLLDLDVQPATLATCVDPHLRHHN